MPEIKWIKITVDVFDDEKIKLIDCLPDRDCTLVIWFKLLALTGKKNEGGLLFMSPKMPYTDEMLSTLFNRPLNNIRLALNTFIDFGMIEINDDKKISVVNWEKHQNIDGMDKIKEQNKARQKKFRENQKLKQLSVSDNSNVTVALSNGTDKSKIRIDKNNNKKKSNNVAAASSPFIDWKKSFETYQAYIKDGFNKVMTKEYQKSLADDFPALDIVATVKKAYDTYWKTEDGWDKKRSGRSKIIDFKKTVRAILRQDFNHVYKGKVKYTTQNVLNDYERPETRVLND